MTLNEYLNNDLLGNGGDLLYRLETGQVIPTAGENDGWSDRITYPFRLEVDGVTIAISLRTAERLRDHLSALIQDKGVRDETNV